MEALGTVHLVAYLAGYGLAELPAQRRRNELRHQPCLAVARLAADDVYLAHVGKGHVVALQRISWRSVWLVKVEEVVIDFRPEPVILLQEVGHGLRLSRQWYSVLLFAHSCLFSMPQYHCGPLSFVALEGEAVLDAVGLELRAALCLVIVVDDVSARTALGAIHVEQVAALQGVVPVM